jgi:Protein of unknown function (DUF2795)
VTSAGDARRRALGARGMLVVDMATSNPIHVQKFLGGVDYPVDKQALLERARQNGADEETCRLLERLPDQRGSRRPST